MTVRYETTLSLADLNVVAATVASFGDAALEVLIAVGGLVSPCDQRSRDSGQPVILKPGAEAPARSAGVPRLTAGERSKELPGR